MFCTVSGKDTLRCWEKHAKPEPGDLSSPYSLQDQWIIIMSCRCVCMTNMLFASFPEALCTYIHCVWVHFTDDWMIRCSVQSWKVISPLNMGEEAANGPTSSHKLNSNTDQSFIYYSKSRICSDTHDEQHLYETHTAGKWKKSPNPQKWWLNRLKLELEAEHHFSIFHRTVSEDFLKFCFFANEINLELTFWDCFSIFLCLEKMDNRKSLSFHFYPYPGLSERGQCSELTPQLTSHWLLAVY